MRRLTLYILFLLLVAPATGQQRRAVKISLNEGGFSGQIFNTDQFGHSLAVLGDLDGNGVPDLAVGAPGDFSYNIDAGAVWILFLNSDGTVKSNQRVTTGEAGFDGHLDEEDLFGYTLATLGDLNGDGVAELAVGALGDDDEGPDTGAIWILSIDNEGTVVRHQKIAGNPLPIPRSNVGQMLCNETAGTVNCTLAHMSLTAGGDLNGDGVQDLLAMFEVIHSRTDLHLADVAFLLDESGEAQDTIEYRYGEYPQDLVGVGGECSFIALEPHTFPRKCLPISRPGDDDVTDLVCNAVPHCGQRLLDYPDPIVINVDYMTLGVRRLRADGSMERYTPVTSTSPPSLQNPLDPPLPPFEAELPANSIPWPAMDVAGDLDGNGGMDLLVGGCTAEEFGRCYDAERRGAIHRVFITSDHDAKFTQTISPGTTPGFGPELLPDDNFGVSVVSLGDVDGNGLPEIAVGAPAAGIREGSVWILFNEPVPGPEILNHAVSGSPVLDHGVTLWAHTQETLASVSEAAVHFRRGGDSTFFLVDMNPASDSSWTVTIPPLFVTARGLEYYVTARDAKGSLSREPALEFRSLPVRVPAGFSVPVVAGALADGYRIVSFPLDLDVSEARAVLEDDFGAYDIKHWRFFGTHALLNERIELGQDSLSIEPGRAYWLLATDPGLSITSGPGMTVRTDEPLTRSLRSGWHLIGNPYAFPIPKNQVTVDSATITEAMAYEGDWAAADTLEPFTGYAVHLDETATLRLHPHPFEPSPPSGKRAVDHELSWWIGITAEQDRARDADNVAGVSSLAHDGWDESDRPEPPVIGDFVSVSFPHSEWGRTASHYRHDVRSEPAEGIVWPIEVRTKTREAIELRFEKVSTVPARFEVWLVDETAGVRQDLRTKKTYRMTGPGEDNARLLQLVVGTSQFLEGRSDLPELLRFGLAANFPNPFDESTTIRLEVDAERVVDLVIYDVLGRPVATLLQGETFTSGHHAVVWDGRTDSGAPAASGVYFVRVKSGTATLTRSLMRL